MKILITFLYMLYASALFANENVLYFVDEMGNTDIKSIIDGVTPSFVPLNTYSFGKTDAAFWLKIVLDNNSSNPREKVLEFNEVRLNRVEVYNDKGTLERVMGDCVPFVQREYADANVVVMIVATANASTVKYLRVTTQSFMKLEYIFWDKKDYEKHLIKKIAINSFYFGATIIMLLYNFVLFFFIRERAFFDYVFYHFIALIAISIPKGIYAQFLIPYASDLSANAIGSGLFSLMSFAATQFARSYLSTDTIVPKLDVGLKIFLGINVVLLLFSTLGVWKDYIYYMTLFVIVIESTYTILISFWIGIVYKDRNAQIYIMAWFLTVLGMIMTVLMFLGVIPRNDFTIYVMQAAILLELLILSIGLAYRYRTNKEKLEEKKKVLHEQAKLASMGEMLGHIAHQWRQPLSEINSVAMKIEIDYRRKTMNDASLDKNIEQIENITEHMSQTIQDFNGYFKSDKEKRKMPLRPVVEKALDLVMSGLNKNTVDVQIIEKRDESVSIVESELIQVLLVLLNNARDALHDHDVKEKWIKITIDKVKGKASIKVEDNGGGIAEANLSKVFEPYFTTKFESQGVGVGLYMSKMIVEESLGGTLSVSNTVNGARFTIML